MCLIVASQKFYQRGTWAHSYQLDTTVKESLSNVRLIIKSPQSQLCTVHMCSSHTHITVAKQHTNTHRYMLGLAFSPSLQVQRSPFRIARFQRVCVFMYVCVCFTPRHQKQQGALLYHCRSSRGNERAVLLFSSLLPLSLSLLLSLYVSHPLRLSLGALCLCQCRALSSNHI